MTETTLSTYNSSVLCCIVLPLFYRPQRGAVWLGYTHYWKRPLVINSPTYNHILEDFQTLLRPMKQAGVQLAGPIGAGSPIIRYNNVAFNGLMKCGHPSRDLGIAWPSEHASGIHLAPGFDPVVGHWAGGAQLATRCCDGNCSHEPFQFLKREKPDSHPTPGGCFRFCKTAYKPYDLAVCSFLVIAKHHLGSSLLVYSDGTLQHFLDAMQLCEEHLGYGSRFVLDVEPK